MSRIKTRPAQRKHLAEMAMKLPRLQKANPDGSPAFKWNRVLGKDMLDDNRMAKDGHGKPIAANRYYWREEAILVDHYAELQRAFAKGGIKAAEKYCADAQAIVDNATHQRHWLQVWWWKVLLRLNIFTEAMRQQMETFRQIGMKPTNITTKP